MLERDLLAGRVVALSISESADLAEIGFLDIHLADAFVELCRHLLADGATLLYGGDLRTGGYTELLFELIERYRPDTTARTPAFKNTLPWPVHMKMSDHELAKLRADLPRGTAVVCMSIDGGLIREPNSGPFVVGRPTDHDWEEGLTSMRRVTSDMADVRIVLGGKTSGYKGRFPGIAEETLASSDLGRPIFAIGGFGGCAGDVCAALGYAPKRRLGDWNGLVEFLAKDVSLNNRLSSEENGTLATTPHIDEAVAIILRGVTRLFGPT